MARVTAQSDGILVTNKGNVMSLAKGDKVRIYTKRGKEIEPIDGTVEDSSWEQSGYGYPEKHIINVRADNGDRAAIYEGDQYAVLRTRE